MGTMSQNPVDASVATIIERSQPIEIGPILPNMTGGMLQSTQGYTVKSPAIFR